MNNSSYRDFRLFGVPADADVFFLGSGEGEVNDVGRLGVKDISLGLEVAVIIITVLVPETAC